MNGKIDEGDSDVGLGAEVATERRVGRFAEIVQTGYLAVIPKEPGGLVLGSIFSHSLLIVSISQVSVRAEL